MNKNIENLDDVSDFDQNEKTNDYKQNESIPENYDKHVHLTNNDEFSRVELCSEWKPLPDNFLNKFKSKETQNIEEANIDLIKSINGIQKVLNSCCITSDEVKEHIGDGFPVQLYEKLAETKTKQQDDFVKKSKSKSKSKTKTKAIFTKIDENIEISFD